MVKIDNVGKIETGYEVNHRLSKYKHRETANKIQPMSE